MSCARDFGTDWIERLTPPRPPRWWIGYSARHGRAISSHADMRRLLSRPHLDPATMYLAALAAGEAMPASCPSQTQATM